MSDIKFGNSNIDNLMLGNIPVSALYCGTELLWKNEIPPTQATLVVVPIPETATVTLTATGYPTVSGVGTQVITVEKGTLVNVSADGEYPDTAKVTVTANQTFIMDVSQEYVTGYIEAVRDQNTRLDIPDAMVYWNDGVRTNVLGPTTIARTSIRWLASLGNNITTYIKDTHGIYCNTGTMSKNTYGSLNFRPASIFLTVQVQPESAWDANVSLYYNIMPLDYTYLGQGQYKFPVNMWATFNYTVSKQGYGTKTGSASMQNASKTVTVTLEQE